MAHSASVQPRAFKLYLLRWGVSAIAEELGVSRATLSRWIKRGGWTEKRQQAEQLEREAGSLVLEMTRAARESKDPQQAYAALGAARMAGLSDPTPVHPHPKEVAKVLLAALSSHPQLGPLVQKYRAEVIETVFRALDGKAGNE